MLLEIALAEKIVKQKRKVYQGLGEAAPSAPASSGGMVSSIANAANSLFNSISSVFGGSQERKGKEAERDKARAEAYGMVESKRQEVYLQDSINTGTVYDGLFNLRAKELDAQIPVKGITTGEILLGVGIVSLTAVAIVYIAKG